MVIFQVIKQTRIFLAEVAEIKLWNTLSEFICLHNYGIQIALPSTAEILVLKRTRQMFCRIQELAQRTLRIFSSWPNPRDFCAFAIPSGSAQTDRKGGRSIIRKPKFSMQRSIANAFHSSVIHDDMARNIMVPSRLQLQSPAHPLTPFLSLWTAKSNGSQYFTPDENK